MSQAQAVAETDRLPWLADETTPQGERRGVPYLWAIVAGAALIVAAAAWWIGSNVIEKPVAHAPEAQPQTGMPPAEPEIAQPTIPQPQQPQASPQLGPEASPAPVRQSRIYPHRPVRRPVQQISAAPPKPHTESAAAQETSTATETAEQVAAAPTKSQSKPLKLWPASQSQGAQGRIVRIGAFGSRFQAKLGWRYMVRAYPAVAHLPATVVLSRNSEGRPFYRFQIGTTSQAHSEVLCQRMGRINLSCAVVGLPWKPNGVER